MVGFIAVLLVSYNNYTPEGECCRVFGGSGSADDSPIGFNCIICLLFYIVYKSCRLRNFGNASQLFSLTSEALRDCNVAIAHANCCIPSKQVPENNTTEQQHQMLI